MSPYFHTIVHNPELGDNHVGIQYQDTAKGDKMSPFSIICDCVHVETVRSFVPALKHKPHIFTIRGQLVPQT